MSKLGFVFPGQGSQSFGMGKDFYDNFEIARKMVDAASTRLGFDFKELMFTKNDKLSQTEFTQPAILLTSVIAHKLFENETNLKPIYALGHSLGEFSALCSVGAIDYLDAVALVHKRGELMKKACDGKNAGMMALIGLDDKTIEDTCLNAREDGLQVWAANYNSDGQVVVAGLKEDLEQMSDVFKKSGAKRAIILDMSVASHCELLRSAVEPLGELLQASLKDEFISPIVSNVTAQKYQTKEEALALLKEQLTSSVLYKHSIVAFENEVDMFVEFGGSILKGLNKKNTKKQTVSIFDLVSLEDSFTQIS